MRNARACALPGDGDVVAAGGFLQPALDVIGLAGDEGNRRGLLAGILGPLARGGKSSATGDVGNPSNGRRVRGRAEP